MKKLLCLFVTAVMLAAVMSLGVHAELYKDYASAADGDLLFIADFRGEDVCTPVPSIDAADAVTYTPGDDGRSLHIQGIEGYDKNTWYYGGAIKGLTADRTTKYTLVYKIRMNGELGKDNSAGVGGLSWNIIEDQPHDWRFFSNYGNYNSVYPSGEDEPNRTALSSAQQKIDSSYTNGIEDAVADADGFLTCRIDFDGPSNVFKAYAVTANGWTLLEEQDMDEPNANYADVYVETQDVGVWIYTYYEIVDCTLKDVKWFKGINLSDEQLSAVDPRLVSSEPEPAPAETAAPAAAPAPAETAAPAPAPAAAPAPAPAPAPAAAPVAAPAPAAAAPAPQTGDAAFVSIAALLAAAGCAVIALKRR